MFNAVVVALFDAVTLPSTYVFTAFCVGNKTSLVPKPVAVDLLAVFSFVNNAAVVVVAFVVTVFPSAVIAAVAVASFASTSV